MVGETRRGYGAAYKAGLAADFWSPDMNVSRYGVTKWTERDFPWSD